MTLDQLKEIERKCLHRAEISEYPLNRAAEISNALVAHLCASLDDVVRAIRELRDELSGK